MSALAIAAFPDAAAFARGREAAREARLRAIGEWSPFPVEEEAAGGIVRAGAIAGLLGALAFLLFEIWSATVAYPFDAGNRPLLSMPAFVVAPVEVGALVAGIAGVIGFIRRAGLGRLHDPAFDIDELDRASRDRFVLAVACEAEAANDVVALLAEAGAGHTRIVRG